MDKIALFASSFEEIWKLHKFPNQFKMKILSHGGELMHQRLRTPPGCDQAR